MFAAISLLGTVIVVSGIADKKVFVRITERGATETGEVGGEAKLPVKDDEGVVGAVDRGEGIPIGMLEASLFSEPDSTMTSRMQSS